MQAAILNQGRGAWAFSELAEQLSAALWLPIVEEPAEINYVLFWEGPEPPPGSFIPREAVDIAGDKRVQAQLFEAAGVPTPLTVEFASFDEVPAHIAEHTDHRWVLKYPIGCGAAAHRILDAKATVPDNWPTPFIVQEFIEMAEPEVYRTYCAGGSVFGWNVRRFPPNAAKPSPWAYSERRLGLQPSPFDSHRAEEQAKAQASRPPNMSSSVSALWALTPARGARRDLACHIDGPSDGSDREVPSGQDAGEDVEPQ